MSVPVEPRDVLRLRAVASARLGLDFEDSRLGFLAEALGRRLAATRLGSADYLGRLESGSSGREEIAALATEVTIGETYFFRNIEQYRALVGVVLPERLAAAGGRPLRILSAGCASGEEAYSLAMVLREWSPTAAAPAEVRAVDVNPAALERARRGLYSGWSLRDTNAEQRRRWFQPHGADYAVDPGVMAAVTFQERNLVDEDPVLWADESWDVVFCRNVLMYFVPEVMRRVIGRISRALVPGGTLFLGSAETLRGVSSNFHLRHTHGTFYYQVRPRAEWREALHGSDAPPPTAAQVSLLEGARSWVEVIQTASRRIHELTETPPRSPTLSVTPAGVAASPLDLTVALELLRAERFDDAIQHLESAGGARGHDPDVLLVRAALLAHAGRLEAAEGVCAELLAADELEAGAHYLLALCREGRGDRAGADEHDQTAIYLDPTFAMPRLHLGMAARRQGDLVAAARDLSAALLLLEREETSRLLLFGGGFGKEALVALCRAELVASGGQP